MQKLRMMKEILPDMTVRQAHDLAVRILKQYTYEPSIAQILEEWRLMKREQSPVSYAIPHTTVASVHPQVIHRLKQIRQDLQRGKKIESSLVTTELINFARTFFPHISLERIEANAMEIANCKTDREQDRAMHRPYMTNMAMDERGRITLYMTPLRQQNLS